MRRYADFYKNLDRHHHKPGRGTDGHHRDYQTENSGKRRNSTRSAAFGFHQFVLCFFFHPQMTMFWCFSDQLLEEGKKIAEYNIQGESTVYMCLKITVGFQDFYAAVGVRILRYFLSSEFSRIFFQHFLGCLGTILEPVFLNCEAVGHNRERQGENQRWTKRADRWTCFEIWGYNLLTKFKFLIWSYFEHWCKWNNITGFELANDRTLADVKIKDGDGLILAPRQIQ